MGARRTFRSLLRNYDRCGPLTLRRQELRSLLHDHEYRGPA